MCLNIGNVTISISFAAWVSNFVVKVSMLLCSVDGFFRACFFLCGKGWFLRSKDFIQFQFLSNSYELRYIFFSSISCLNDNKARNVKYKMTSSVFLNFQIFLYLNLLDIEDACSILVSRTYQVKCWMEIQPRIFFLC